MIRLLRDPHEPYYQWRVVDGERQVRYNSVGMRETRATDDYRGWIDSWYTALTAVKEGYPFGGDVKALFAHTTERVAIWADLTLQPTE